MMTVETIYLICFTVGVVWAVVTGLLSGLLGDHGFGHGHVGGGIGHDSGDLGSQDWSGSLHFSPLSPTVISTFLVFFGGSGYVYLTVFNIDAPISVIPALVTAFAAGAGVYFLLDYVFTHTQGGTDIDQSGMVGRNAEVTVGIPAQGMGEIAFSTAGGRVNAGARSDTGAAIPHGAVVEVVKIVGQVYWVRPESAPAPGVDSPVPPEA